MAWYWISRATAENDPVSTMRTKVFRARSMSMIAGFTAWASGSGRAASGTVPRAAAMAVAAMTGHG